MKITLNREALLKPLQLVSGAVEKRQTLPILSHILFIVKDKLLKIVATDLELELVGQVALTEPCDECEITVPARKLIDICRALPEGADIELSLDKNRLLIRSGRSRFVLSTLPASEFPRISETSSQIELSLKQSELKLLLNDTAFAMAQQDVRYYLNGILFALGGGELKVVATDGHRLALSALKGINTKEETQIIVPRKGVVELLRLLSDSDDEAKLLIGTNNIQLKTETFEFTSKLVDGKFPDFSRVIPKNNDKLATIDRDSLKQALSRAAILCNEKYHGVRLLFKSKLLTILANNPDQEEAEEELAVNYPDGDELEVGFNVKYLLDAISALDSGEIKLLLRDSNSSTLIEHTNGGNSLYVVMPMRL